MKPGLRIEHSWDDPHLIDAWVSVSNSPFAGAALLYVDRGALKEAARVLDGFPSGPDDKRRIDWGGPNLGIVSFDFAVVDLAGHCQLVAEVHSGSVRGDTPGQAAIVRLPVEAAAIDRFVVALRQAGPNHPDACVLEASEP